eukprot:CAMPEP_0185772656 /NCGR_PEP_ID=MMETSP1174-20130828/70083_1 /TAXON_ID=35687 /ORGANISM="Dictyocha speculum, Strain CCMP1381" /LENGTH=248 /DNA_ID=CAMNT_0028459025 /DNA_START=78 /DNA_END=824 /DNA_ORIENTATION=+
MLRTSLIPQAVRGGTYSGLFSVVDWLPTILEGALGIKAMEHLFNETRMGSMDGVNHLDAIMHGDQVQPPRTDLLYNIDYTAMTEDEGMVSGAYRVGDMKLLVNVKYQPVWPLEKTNGTQASTRDRDDWYNEKFADFLFNVTADPTESTDLRETHDYIFKELREKFSQYEESMVPTAFCAAADNKLAEETFRKTEFVVPWINNTNFKCPEIKSSDEVAHITTQWCLYKLIPSAHCRISGRGGALKMPVI